MALQFISKSVWNEYMYRFVKDYCDNFPELTHARAELETRLKDLVELKDRPTGDISEEEDERKQLVLISEMFIESFKPFATRLKECDETVFKEPDCLFVRHLQLLKVWKSEFSEEDKQEVWKILNGAYLILELVICTPEHIMAKLEKMIGELFDRVVVKKKDFVKSDFTASAKIILRELDQESINRMTEYFWQFITSRFTPIYALVDEQYHYVIHPLLQGVQSEKGRKFLMTKMSPLVENIKSRVGKTSIMIDEKSGAVNYDGDLKDGDLKELIERRMKEKERILECIIDAMADVLSRNKDMIKNLMENPADGLKALMKDFIPTITGLVTATGLGGGGVAKHEEEMEREKEEYYLKGAPTLLKGGALPPLPPLASSSVSSVSSLSSSSSSASSTTLARKVESIVRPLSSSSSSSSSSSAGGYGSSLGESAARGMATFVPRY